MPERRTEPRHRVLKAGTIVLNRAGGISCTVRNLSATGACLGVESPIGIPDHFTLIVEGEQAPRACRVAWRRDKRIGVAF